MGGSKKWWAPGKVGVRSIVETRRKANGISVLGVKNKNTIKRSYSEHPITKIKSTSPRCDVSA